MSRLALVPLALAAMAAHAAADGNIPGMLQKKLGALAGPDAQDCGSVPLHGARAAVVACARSATVANRAYRLTVELDGTDFAWQGAARDAAGKSWVVFYGADAEPGATPTLSQVLCREIRFPDKGDDVIDCVPSTGG